MVLFISNSPARQCLSKEGYTIRLKKWEGHIYECVPVGWSHFQNIVLLKNGEHSDDNQDNDQRIKSVKICSNSLISKLGVERYIKYAGRT